MTTYTTFEIPDIEKLKCIVNNYDALGLDPAGKAGLMAYAKKYKNGKVAMNYRYARGSSSGRQYAPGIQPMARAVRHTICEGIYKDYDIKNAHPVLLEQYCTKHQITCELLKKYNGNRDAYLGGDGSLKTQVISALYGGSLNQSAPDWLVSLNAEFLSIRRQVAYLNTEIFAKVKKEKDTNFEGACAAKVLCEIENKCLVEAIRTVPHDVSVVLVFDGFMLPVDYEIDLRDVEQRVLTATGYKVDFVEKPMTECLVLPTDVNPFEEFEKSYAKLNNPPCFIRLTTQGFQQLTKGELYHIAGDLPDKVLERWLDYPLKKTYERMDSLPPPLPCPPDVLNVWKDFPIQEVDVGQGIIEPMVNLFETMFPDVAVREYMYKWFGHILRSPGIKTGVGIVWRSEQGCGKGIILEQMMKKMIGERMYMVDNPDLQLFGRFNEARNGKLIVNVNDCNVGAIKKNMEGFKNYITAEYLDYDDKGHKPIQMLNSINLIITTNKDCPIKMEASDRRWVIIDIEKTNAMNPVFFKQVGAWLENKQNIRAFYDFLVAQPSCDFANERPITEMYAEIKYATADIELMWLASVTGIDLNYDDFREWVYAQNMGADFRMKNRVQFGIYMTKVPGTGVQKTAKSNRRFINDRNALEAHLTKAGVVNGWLGG